MNPPDKGQFWTIAPCGNKAHSAVEINIIAQLIKKLN
jgi:hypothetical protein